ncbi:hypothetical protein DXG01_007309 [Tephrocybe rancida]|nr:hypothetical protein DXG01_007309 [Tephrocybe rancida]
MLLLAINIAYFGMTTLNHMGIVDGVVEVMQPSLTVMDRLLVASLPLSAATNTMTTLIVGWKAWRHRRMWKFSGRRKKSKAEKTLLVIVESGSDNLKILYVIFANVYGRYSPSTDFAFLVIKQIYTQAMYWALATHGGKTH